MRAANALVRLRECADWSERLLVAYPIRPFLGGSAQIIYSKDSEDHISLNDFINTLYSSMKQIIYISCHNTFYQDESTNVFEEQ